VRWRHKRGNRVSKSNPGERLPEVVARYGAPDVLDRSAGGFAVWRRSPRISPWERLEMHDELVPHMDPAPHNDFYYAWYRLPTKNKRQVDAIRALSKSVTYDPLKELVRARCHFDGANISTVWLAAQIVYEGMTAAKAKSLYGPTIMSTIPGNDHYDAGAERRMLAYLRKKRVATPAGQR
jgi:hypothetical protein